MAVENKLGTINPGEREWLNSLGRMLGWGEDEFLTTKYFITGDITVDQLESQRALHITQIREGHTQFPYIDRQTDIYAEVITFRISRFIDKHDDVKNLTLDDRQRYDELMEFATSVAFADVSGILSRDEIEKVLKGGKVSPQVRGREIL